MSLVESQRAVYIFTVRYFTVFSLTHMPEIHVITLTLLGNPSCHHHVCAEDDNHLLWNVHQGTLVRSFLPQKPV